MDKEQIPFPKEIINWLDIARGIGQVVCESAFDFLTKPFKAQQ